MTETSWSWLVKQHRLNVEQYKNYSSKLELRIRRYVDLITELKDFQLAIFFDFLRLYFFSLGGYVKGLVYVPHLPANLNQITTVLQTATQGMLQCGWEELEYRIDVCRVS